MTKLKLRIDNLRVETFETAGTRAELRGTVDAHVAKPTRLEPCLEETFLTGACCEYTWGVSCMETNCLECDAVTAAPCD